jgi:septal ring factor EnvC (AmiA/AmiB activator)
LLFRCFVGQIATKFGTLGVNMKENSVVPFAPGDALDKAGDSILKLLQKAAGVAEQSSQDALDMAQKLSHQLRAAEQRITDLEAEVERHGDRAERAEQWLHKVYSEIEDRFLRQEGSRGRTMSR